jgi:hypothetical protein
MLWPDELWPQDIGGLAVLKGAGRPCRMGRMTLPRRWQERYQVI